jgi:CrcB protein
MKYLILVGLGGALGAIFRHLLGTTVHALWEGFIPVGTLLVNVLGSFCIGIVFVLLERQLIHPDWRSVLMVGFLGAFTTFSTFSLETINLIEQGFYAHAGAYMLLSVVTCVTMAGAGIYLGRWLF